MTSGSSRASRSPSPSRTGSCTSRVSPRSTAVPCAENAFGHSRLRGLSTKSISTSRSISHWASASSERSETQSTTEDLRMFLTRYAAVRKARDEFRRIAHLANSSNRRAIRELRAKRDRVDRRFAELARKSSERFEGEVLIDAQFDNPNYWLRVSLLRAALGLAYGNETGLLGGFRRDECSRTMRILGIR